MGVGSGLESDFGFQSSRPRGRFKFKLVDGPGVLDSEPDVTGCGFVLFLFEVLDDCLAFIEDGSRVWM